MWTQSLNGLIVLLVFSTVLAVEIFERRNGLVAISQTKIQPRAILVPHGGNYATYGDVSYIVFTSNGCQGAIINEYTVLTYGSQCLLTNCDDCKPMKVKVGSINICTSANSGHDVKITKIIRHPKNFLIMFHTEKIVFNSVIKPIKLPKFNLNDAESTQVIISGWEGESTTDGVSTLVHMKYCLIFLVFKRFSTLFVCLRRNFQ